MDIGALNEEVSRYALTPRLLNEILEILKKSIIANSNLIMKANKEDVKLNKKQIKIDDFINIIESYKEDECILNDDERKIIIYKGNPYLTLNLCLQALTQRTKVLLMQEGLLTKVNEVLIKIFEKVLEDYKITNLIDKIQYSLEEYNEIKNLFDETIVIGNTTIYNLLEKQTDVIKYFPYYNIGLYCDSDDLLKLQEAIYIYANENEYEIEIYYEDDINKVIEMINYDQMKNVAILLTQNNTNKEKFENEIKNKKIVINENPFKNEESIIYNYLR